MCCRSDDECQSAPRVEAELRAVLYSEVDGCIDQKIIDGFKRLRRELARRPVEGVMFGHRITVEIHKLPQRHPSAIRSARSTQSRQS